jgi:transposase
MPWKECSVMDKRLRFVAQLLDGEAMSEVCCAFGISRKTGYKIFERYKEHGLEALTVIVKTWSDRRSWLI